MSPEDLLKMAMGITPEAQEMAAEENLKKHYLVPTTQKEYFAKRRVFRRTMFSVRRKLHYNQTEFSTEEKVVKEIIDTRLDPSKGFTWDSFTFLWDITPNYQNPFQIVQKQHWFKEGGAIDQDIGTFYPSAFTEQGIA
jgi:hypothetical protein